MPSRRRMHQGFTLVELIITLVIVGVLSAVALPSYLQFVQKGRRSDAYDAVALVQQQQERYRSQNLSYAAALADLKLGTISGGGMYQVAISDVTPQGYTLKATPSPGSKQLSDHNCQAFVVVVFKASMQRSAKNAGGDDSTATCWPQ